MLTARALVVSVIVVLCRPGAAQEAPPPAEPTPGAFEALWYDGQAEVNGYRWRGTRYGELRSGEAVAIFVTEPMGAESHVKLDRPEEHRGEALTVLKLNLVRDFQTGLYDYATMVSAWVDVRDMRAVKLTFSSAEWCGHVFESLDVTPKGVALDLDSYFQGESTRATLAARPDGIHGDQLLIWLRGLRGRAVAPGEARTLPYLADAFERRLRHQPASWGELTVTRAAEATSTTVPAGTFDAMVYALAASDGRTGRVTIEDAYPHRLLGWEWERGAELLDSAELTGSRRMKYWELHAEGQEALRKELGLD